MISRFHRPGTELASLSTQNCDRSPECPCCTALRQARAAACFDLLPAYESPLTPGVQLVNFSQSDAGRKLRVDLGEDWARMLAQLRHAGEGLIMTRNTAAILGQRRRYPALSVTSSGSKGASGEGGLWLDFRQLGAARAVHLRRETGHVFGVEFADQAGHLVHRFTLTPESDMDEFFAWVRLHQACTADRPAAWLEREENVPFEPSAQTLRQCDGAALVSVFAACLDRAVPVRMTVRGTAVTQRTEFTPRTLQPSAGWWFVTDDIAGLHFQPDFIHRVTIGQQAHAPGGTRVVLHAALQDGTVALVLEAGHPAAEEPWRALLAATA